MGHTRSGAFMYSAGSGGAGEPQPDAVLPCCHLQPGGARPHHLHPRRRRGVHQLRSHLQVRLPEFKIGIRAHRQRGLHQSRPHIRKRPQISQSIELCPESWF